MVTYQQSEAKPEAALQKAPAVAAIPHGPASVGSAKYLRECRAPNTRRAYLCDTKQFVAWCAARRLYPFPASPATLVSYLAWLADSGRRVATVERALAAISQAHLLAGYESPRKALAVRQLMAGIRCTLGTAVTRKAPVLVDDLRRMITATPDDLRGLRDRAILLLGFSGAFRRSELVGLDVADVEFVSEGVQIHLRRSKTDPESAGQVVGVPRGSAETCPVEALRRWMRAAEISQGPIFRAIDRHGRVATRRLNGRAVANLVKAQTAKLGLDPSHYAGHSLRAGFATSAIRAGKPEHLVMRQTRHRSIDVFRCYVRDVELFAQNAAAGLGL